MRRLRPVVMALAAIVASCGGSSPHRVGPPGPLAEAYLRLAVAANAQVDTAEHHLEVDDTVPSAVSGDLRAIAAAKRSFDQGIAGLTFPPSLSARVRRLLDADAALETLLEQGAAAATVAATTAADLARVEPQIVAAGDTAVSAAAAVRQGLGLPRPPARSGSRSAPS